MTRFLISLLAITFMQTYLYSQSIADCDMVKKDVGIDIMIADTHALSLRAIHPGFFENSEIIFCPAGIRRSSPDDIKKRWSFDWEVKYNNFYIRSGDGLVFEGMNDRGFSASLMYLENSQLPEKEKGLIPIAASLSVNFFIDHFTNIDTALLAIWDTRIFDDISMGCDWPFRIILHDSAGGSAYIEHIEGQLRVFTPEAPSVVSAGSDYTHLLMVQYLDEYKAVNKSEEDYIFFSEHIKTGSKNAVFLIADYYKIDSNKDLGQLVIMRGHEEAALIISNAAKEFEVRLNEVNFTPGKEISKTIF